MHVITSTQVLSELLFEANERKTKSQTVRKVEHRLSAAVFLKQACIPPDPAYER